MRGRMDVELDRQSAGKKAVSGSACGHGGVQMQNQIEQRAGESRISWTTVCQVLCFGHRDGMEVRAGETYEQGEDSGAQGGQANPRLRSPPPAPPQTRSPVA